MAVRYSKHLLLKLKIRRIPVSLPRKVVLNPKEKYTDTFENSQIAIGQVNYNNKLVNLVVVYSQVNKDVTIITAYTIETTQIKNRKASGRWI